MQKSSWPFYKGLGVSEENIAVGVLEVTREAATAAATYEDETENSADANKVAAERVAEDMVGISEWTEIGGTIETEYCFQKHFQTALSCTSVVV